MSIDVLLGECVARGDLSLLRTFDPNIRPVRTVYLSPKVNEFIEDPSESRAGRLHADLDRFIGGELITASMVPYKAGSAFIGLLNPPEDCFWDIRSQDPRPALRLLGGFIKKDVFVGLVLRLRKDLADGKSREWSAAVRECNTEWQRRFIAFKPLCGERLHDYLSNSISVDRSS